MRREKGEDFVDGIAIGLSLCGDILRLVEVFFEASGDEAVIAGGPSTAVQEMVSLVGSKNPISFPRRPPLALVLDEGVGLDRTTVSVGADGWLLPGAGGV